MSHPMEVTPQELENQLKISKIPILVEFWGSWCPPCQVMNQILEVLQKEFGQKIKILKINLDKNPTVSSSFKIKGAPTFILFNQGKEIKRAIGAQSKKQLMTMIKEEL